jgi:membrane-bound metal-dependent hydrolase YbcI (DUF457 family)
MRVGHLGVALVAKRVCPRAPLWLLVGAAYGPDIIEVALRLFGNYNRELSHSLIAVAICATVVAGAYAIITTDIVAASAIWLTYALHWPADFITGIKPTWPGGPEVGLRLYDRPVLAWIVDLAVLGIGWWIYRARPSAVKRLEMTS